MCGSAAIKREINIDRHIHLSLCGGRDFRHLPALYAEHSFRLSSWKQPKMKLEETLCVVIEARLTGWHTGDWSPDPSYTQHKPLRTVLLAKALRLEYSTLEKWESARGRGSSQTITGKRLLLPIQCEKQKPTSWLPALCDNDTGRG